MFIKEKTKNKKTKASVSSLPGSLSSFARCTEDLVSWLGGRWILKPLSSQGILWDVASKVLQFILSKRTSGLGRVLS